MIISTKAIVISTIKYGDSSLIVKCYTASDGIKTYLLKGILSSKKGKLRTAYFQPMSLLNIEASHKNKGTMEHIKEVKVSYPYTTIYMDMKKNAIAFFISEVLNMSLRETEKDPLLFRFLETALLWLDTHHMISNFHMIFMLNLTRYLGFYPDDSDSELPFFNLLEGAFSTHSEAHTISGEELVLFKSLLGINFDGMENIKLSKRQRNIVVNMLILYFQLHLQGFKKPKSASVLNEVFN